MLPVDARHTAAMRVTGDLVAPGSRRRGAALLARMSGLNAVIWS